MENKPVIITIERQFGSGGREIGEKLAHKLNIGYYDKALIEEAAKAHGLNQTVVETYDEKPAGRFAFTMDVLGLGHAPKTPPDMPIGMQVAFAQFAAIREVAGRGDCVIIGRCADFVLADHPHVLHVFVHASDEKRLERVTQRYNLSPDEAKRALRTVDKRRASYYNYYTDQSWGDMRNYHLTLDSGDLGIQGCVEMIARYLELRP